jgi:hypothetical protein
MSNAAGSDSLPRSALIELENNIQDIPSCIKIYVVNEESTSSINMTDHEENRCWAEKEKDVQVGPI